MRCRQSEKNPLSPTPNLSAALFRAQMTCGKSGKPSPVLLTLEARILEKSREPCHTLDIGAMTKLWEKLRTSMLNSSDAIFSHLKLENEDSLKWGTWVLILYLGPHFPRIWGSLSENQDHHMDDCFPRSMRTMMADYNHRNMGIPHTMDHFSSRVW